MKLLKWWRANQKEVWFFTKIFVAWGIFILMLTQRFTLFANAPDGQQWFTKWMEGALGAFFGAGVAIVYAEWKDANRDKKKRVALATALMSELTYNVEHAGKFIDEATTFRFKNRTLKTLENHIELFHPDSIIALNKYRADLADMQAMLRSYSKSPRKPTSDDSGVAFGFVSSALAGAGVIAWVGSKYAAYALIGVANPPAAAVGFTVFGALTAGWMAASAINSYVGCLRQYQ